MALKKTVDKKEPVPSRYGIKANASASLKKIELGRFERSYQTTAKTPVNMYSKGQKNPKAQAQTRPLTK